MRKTKEMFPFDFKYYLRKIQSFSPHASDTSGTEAYKSLRREVLIEKDKLENEVQDLRRELRRTKSDLDQLTAKFDSSP